MKRNLLGSIAVAVAAIAFSSPAVLAQHGATKVDVPFAFQLGKSSLPAGTYLVNSNDGILLTVSEQSTGQKLFAMGQHEIENTAREPRLVFHKYGDKYFLADIWSSSKDGLKLHVTRQEQEYRASANQAQPEQDVLLAMN
jgi:hypothetical protein